MEPPPQKDPNHGQPIQEGMHREFHVICMLCYLQTAQSDGKEMAVPNHEAKYTTTLLFLFPKLNVSTSDGSQKLRVVLM
jgi:hypothetical protein